MRQFKTEEIRQSYESLKAKTEKSGYLLNADEEFTLGIVESLLINQERYGYPLCPCRLSSGNREADLDIICPCDYRDPDLAEYGRCYCALYVSMDATPEQLNGSIPERRPKNPAQAGKAETMPIWRCPVCGYLCARPNPPEVCPICGASGDRFERFDFALNIVRSELRRPLNNTGTGENNNEKRLIKIYTQNAKSYYWQLAATAREETEARAIIRELLNRPDTLTIRMASSGKVIEEFGAMMDSKTKGDKAKMKKYKCSVCGYIYDPAKGDPSSGVKPGTAFEDLPEDWVCPVCGSPKSKFKPIEE